MIQRRSRLLAYSFAVFLGAGLLIAYFHGLVPSVKESDVYKKFSENLGFQRLVEQPPATPPYGALVLASGADTDLRWTQEVEQSWTLYPYDIRRPNHEDPRLRFPASKGHEAMIYLSYILSNYDTLPWAVIFMHGHLKAWHQEATALQLVEGLNRSALAYEGYISLRCDWYPSCPAEIRPVDHDAVIWGPEYQTKGTEAAIAGNWRLLFPGEPLPETISSPCCAQFAVTRQTILRRPKEDYGRMREWILSSLLEDELSGRVLEKLWAYMFTGKAVHCPPPRQCACEFFDYCDETKFKPLPEGVPPPPQWP